MRQATSYKRRQIPPDAPDPEHSFKCKPDIRADQVFTPLNLEEKEFCLDSHLWQKSIETESQSVRSTFRVVKRPKDVKVLDLKWVFKAKQDPETGCVSKLKSRVIVRGFNMQKGMHYLETYAPTMQCNWSV